MARVSKDGELPAEALGPSTSSATSSTTTSTTSSIVVINPDDPESWESPPRAGQHPLSTSTPTDESAETLTTSRDADKGQPPAAPTTSAPSPSTVNTLSVDASQLANPTDEAIQAARERQQRQRDARAQKRAVTAKCICKRESCICLDSSVFTSTDEFIAADGTLKINSLSLSSALCPPVTSAMTITDDNDVDDRAMSNVLGVPAPLLSASLCRRPKSGGEESGPGKNEQDKAQNSQQNVSTLDADLRGFADEICDENADRGTSALALQAAQAIGASALPLQAVQTSSGASALAQQAAQAISASALPQQAAPATSIAGDSIAGDSIEGPTTINQSLFPNYDVMSTQQLPPEELLRCQQHKRPIAAKEFTKYLLAKEQAINDPELRDGVLNPEMDEEYEEEIDPKAWPPKIASKSSIGKRAKNAA